MVSLRKTVDRRNFLKLGAVASGVVVGGCGPPGGSEAQPTNFQLGYRPLGGTGLEVSEVAFGAHGLDRPDLMRAALDAGINTFCVSGQYLDGMGGGGARRGDERPRWPPRGGSHPHW